MPHGYMERQYQLQAQKRHQESLKQDYYKKASQYFEQESMRTNQFNSWNTRSIQKINDLQDRILKKELLGSRREKLKHLLEEEEQAYKFELEKINLSKTRRETTPSLEALRQKLKEKRAEESLYYPRSCRRPAFYHSHKSVDNIPASISGYNFEENFEKAKSEDHSPIHRKHFPNQRPALSEGCLTHYFESKEPLAPKQSLKYASRYSRQSLENTNVRKDSNEDLDKSKTDENDNAASYSKELSDKVVERRERRASSADTEIMNRKTVFDLNESTNAISSMRANASSDSEPKELPPEYRRHKTFFGGHEDMTDDVTIANPKLSLKMFRYLKHSDLKRKILDLCQREQMACRKQCWDDALRLRDMRGYLTLLKNKNLYENNDLDIVEGVKKSGLKNITALEKLLKSHQGVCNGTLYSDEAKHLWKQWEQHDDEVEKSNLVMDREAFLKDLEEEWKRLAFKDKKRMSQMFDRVMTNSALQDEHELSAIITAANFNVYNDEFDL